MKGGIFNWLSSDADVLVAEMLILPMLIKTSKSFLPPAWLGLSTSPPGEMLEFLVKLVLTLIVDCVVFDGSDDH